MPAAPTTQKKQSSFVTTMSSPMFRGATIAVFISSLGVSAAAPQIASFLVNDLHASLTVAGLYYLTNLTAPIAGYLVGSRSDHTGKRLNLFRLCALAGFLGWIGIAFSTQIWMPFAISAVVLGFAGAAGSQLFAAIHDYAKGHPDGEGIVAIVRMSVTAGWVIGPVVGSFLASAFGYHAMLFVIAACNLAQIIPIGFLRDAPPAAEGTATTPTTPTTPVVVHQRPGLKAMWPLLVFTGLYILVYAGEPIKYGYLPIYMRDDMHLPAVVSGAVIGIQPLIELLLMPLSVIVARRTGMMRLMVVGAVFGVGAYLCFALTDNVVGMFAGQVLMGGVWGIFAALGIILAQRLLSQAVATASAIFMSSTAIASALGGLTGGLGVGVVGLPLVFLMPALYCLLGAIGIAVMSRKHNNGNEVGPELSI
ncbi:MFS transporter [Humibacter sp. RRB41]|uniref:MFS transporter n=1 Tax=Humibacter sp. RRB41 TaxID=2919946 RepID=UPI001FAA9280|nr:MFS transporter [Humibacter sp. RRB41]